MICMINGTFKSALNYGNPQSFGAMATPYKANITGGILSAIDYSRPWCLDNGCFTRYDPPSITKMLERWRGYPYCKFAVVPDVVGNHAETLILWRAWVGTFQRLGYPPAFVLQNGLKMDDIPFGSISAIFIGGDTEFKFSLLVRDVINIARGRDIWVHMGRVNTINRIRYAGAVGVDSVDGTAAVRFMGKTLKSHLPYYNHTQRILI